MEKLEELVALAEKGEIKYTPRQLKKFTEDRLQIIYNEYQAKQLDQTNELFTDLLIVQFDKLLKNTSLIKPDSNLAKKLQDRELFKKDVKSVVSHFTFLLPFMGLIEGAVVTTSEIFDNYSSSKSNTKKEEDESFTCTSEERKEHCSSEGGESQHEPGQDSESV